MPDEVIRISTKGALSTEGKNTSRRLGKLAGTYGLTVDSPGMLVLRRQPGGTPQSGGNRVVMAGEVLSKMSVLETISVVANSNWRGELHVFGGDNEMNRLVFDQGALKYAWSTASEHRLGEILFRQGFLTQDQRTQLLAESKEDRRLGQQCVSHGYLTQEQLFQQLQKQIEQVFFGALLVADGCYVFCIPDEGSEPPPHSVHLSVQGLLMEGVQRIDEMALFRERIPDPRMVPEPKENATTSGLDELSQKIFGLCDGKRSIEDIARDAGCGEFLATKTIYHFLTGNLATLRSAVTTDPEEVRQIVARFNNIMRDIFVAAATYGSLNAIRTSVQTWLAGSPHTPALGKDVQEDGSLDAKEVATRLQDGSLPHPMEALLHGLHELVSYALFSASGTLPRDQELLLARDVDRQLRAMRPKP
ncbi:MAG: DUF4388 domain-containing protein [Myxococcales bacterium]|nr:DUF4388 domain-containing protein [Myxococcales bacterium]